MREIIKRKIKLKSDNKNINNMTNINFVDDNISIKSIDYYHSNVIARASKTMNECKISRENFKKTGTEN